MSLACVTPAAAKLLGRHVGGRAVADLGAGELVGDGGEAEVHDDEVAALVHHDVLRLEVAVDDAAVVRGGESGAELARGLQRLVAGQPADAREQRGEIFAVHVFHRDERRAVYLADVEHAADVGMRNQAGDADLAVEALEQPRIARRLFGEELERDRLPEREIGGAVDFAHAAAPEQSENAVAAAQQRARQEAALVGG